MTVSARRERANAFTAGDHQSHPQLADAAACVGDGPILTL
jgi:hypothetical protein